MLAQHMAQSQPQGQGAPAQGQPNQGAAPDKGEMYKVTAGQMLKYVYSDEGMNAITEMMTTGGPEQAMPKLIAQILDMTNDSAVMVGKKIPPEIIFQSGMELARALSEIGQKAGVLDEATEKEITEAAFFDGIAQFAQAASQESLTEQDRQRFSQLIDLLEQAEAKGNGGQSA